MRQVGEKGTEKKSELTDEEKPSEKLQGTFYSGSQCSPSSRHFQSASVRHHLLEVAIQWLPGFELTYDT